MKQVPYVSQITGAEAHNNDCGSASALMLLQAFKRDQGVSVNRLYDEMNPGADRYLRVSEIMLACQRYGLTLEWQQGLDGLPPDRPTIPLIERGPLVDAFQSEPGLDFRGAHFVVCVAGYSTDAPTVLIHDPYWHGYGGAYRHIPWDVFARAWKAVPQGEGNPPAVRCALVPTIPLGAAGRQAVALAGLNVRSEPRVNRPWEKSNRIGGLEIGAKVTVYETVQENGNTWARIGEGKWVAEKYGTSVYLKYFV